MVRRYLPGQSEAFSCEIPPIHRTPCGADRTADEPSPSEDHGKGQGNSQSQGSDAGAATRSVASNQFRGGGCGDPGCRTVGCNHRTGLLHGASCAVSHGPTGEHDEPDPDAPEPGAPSLEQPCRTVDSHLIADFCAQWQANQEPNKIFDPMLEVDVGENIYLARENNWVAQEMWKYLSSKGILQNPKRLSQNHHDLLEVYCSPESELTNQATAQGLLADRFCLRDGDLSTVQGRFRLYDRMVSLLPRNIWLSPKCKAWCKWNMYNMSKSPELARKIMESRQDEQVHLLLCDAIFQFQTWRSPQSHAHLEQPDGSHMLYQEELAAILEQTMLAKCDMCQAGHLKHPETGRYLQKRTQIITTSSILHQHISKHQCSHNHEHDTVSGSCRHPNLGRVNVSQFTELYTRVFATRMARCFQCISQVREQSHGSPELVFAGHSMDELQTPAQKRQKLTGKQPVSNFYQQLQQETDRNAFIQHVASLAPRVGKRFFTEGDPIQMAEALYPGVEIKVIEACKGADRRRPPPPNISRETAPLRLTMGIHRIQQGTFCDDHWENWTQLTRRNMLSKAPPAKVLITVFARPKSTPNATNPTNPDSNSITSHDAPISMPQEPENKRICIRNPHEGSHSLEPAQAFQPSHSEMLDASLQHSSDRKADDVTQHGPKFRSLNAEQKQQLRRMHVNLGHPDAQLLGNVLRDQGWDSEAIEGIKDMHCPTCYENQKPKISRPSHLGEPKAFNDMVSIDAVQWTSEQGMQFTFYHMIDSGTNFQVAFTCEQGTSKEVSNKMVSHWFNWAGPPKTLMSDSAGEFCSDEFAAFLQSHDIQSVIIPAEAHWQMGKCERHGAILQDMLNKAQKDLPITTREELERMLCQCTAAKNSLSRCRGYSPEILVLGKSRHMPASVSHDDLQPSDFMFAEETTGSDKSEITQFHENLKLRETARVAFIRSDHDMKLRRSFLRRARPPRCSAQAGKWVMYWRNGKGAALGLGMGQPKSSCVKVKTWYGYPT